MRDIGPHSAVGSVIFLGVVVVVVVAVVFVVVAIVVSIVIIDDDNNIEGVIINALLQLLLLIAKAVIARLSLAGLALFEHVNLYQKFLFH